MILREAAWIGAAGALIGLGVGVALGRGLVRLVTRTINDLYFTVTVEGVAMEPAVVVKAAALGLGATLLAALPPALEAASAEPRLTTLRSISEERVRSLLPRAAALGAAMGASGWAVLELPTRSLGVSFAGLALVMSGLALITPAGAVILVRGLRPPLRAVAGTLGVIAARGSFSLVNRP